MISLRLPPGGKLRILCLGAHCDDIEIGCGGALLSLLRDHPGAEITWVVFSADDRRERELRASAARFLRAAGTTRLIVHRFRDGFFPAQFADIKGEMEALKSLPPPDLIFSHHRHDAHQDHRQVAQLTWNTFRNHLVLEYEIPKYDGDLTTPNAYICVGKTQMQRKIRILRSCYESQAGRSWFSADTFQAIMRLRGIECGSQTGFAEGFHVPKLQIV
jgi:LmbE family N-acetylglucosaminyl deacetylase